MYTIIHIGGHFGTGIILLHACTHIHTGKLQRFQFKSLECPQHNWISAVNCMIATRIICTVNLLIGIQNALTSVRLTSPCAGLFKLMLYKDSQCGNTWNKRKRLMLYKDSQCGNTWSKGKSSLKTLLMFFHPGVAMTYTEQESHYPPL